MQSVIETITPSMATKYLEGNKLNRPIRQSHVDFLADEMKSGRWKSNGATIVFNGESLIDGQHRLWAIITGGVPIKTLVVRGVDHDSFSTVDTGRPRNASDVLAITGNKNTNTLSAAIRFLIDYKTGKLLDHGTVRVSNQVVLNYLNENLGIKESVHYIASFGWGRWLLSTASASALHYVMAKKDKDLADNFFSGIRNGFAATAGETFLAFREKLIACSLSTAKLRARILAIYAIKAWNAQRSGHRLKIFKWSEGEKVPKIV